MGNDFYRIVLLENKKELSFKEKRELKRLLKAYPNFTKSIRKDVEARLIMDGFITVIKDEDKRDEFGGYIPGNKTEQYTNVKGDNALNSHIYKSELRVERRNKYKEGLEIVYRVGAIIGGVSGLTLFFNAVGDIIINFIKSIR